MQYLSQDLIRMALNPQTGKTRFSWYSALDYGLVGSLLLDLVLQDKLEIDNDNRVIGAIAEGELVGKAVSKAIFTIQATTLLGAINGG
jgi:hypothetical protein